MTYKILEINHKESWIKIEVIFDDGEKYTKRMMANITNEDTIQASIIEWLADYIPLRNLEKTQVNDNQKIINRQQSISVETLPESSMERNRKIEAHKAKELIDKKIRLEKERESKVIGVDK